MKNLIKQILITILCFVLFGCNSAKDKFRKAVKISRTEQKDIHIQTKNQVNASTVNIEAHRSMQITPVDETKPVVIITSDGKRTAVTNAKIEYSETKEIKKDTLSRTQQVNRIDKSVNSDIVAIKKETKHKKTSVDWKFYLLGIPVVLGLFFTFRWLRSKSVL